MKIKKEMMTIMKIKEELVALFLRRRADKAFKLVTCYHCSRTMVVTKDNLRAQNYCTSCK